MKLISLFFVMILSFVKINAALPLMSDMNLGYGAIYAGEVFNDKILLAGVYKSKMEGHFKEGIVKILKNDVLTQLPDSIERNGKNEPLLIHSLTRINIDSSAIIWLTGDVVYKFSNNKWTEIYYDDEFKTIR